MKKTVCILTLFLFFTAHAQLPSGFVGKYFLDNNTATDYSGNNYNGSLTSTSATTNRFGTSNKAISLTSGSSTGSLPVGLVTALQNDFSIGYWFKTSMTANSGSQWYNGNAMVDGEVCGVTTDWGTALIDGGKICFGIGNPDITIKTTSNYNDGNWHFLTVTRDKVGRSIILYIDGSQKAALSGSPTNSSLTAPGFLGLGRNPCSSSAVYTGALDDIIAYNRVLTGTEVTNLYNFLNSSPLPLYWMSFTGEIKSNEIKLKWEIDQPVNNDHFEVEHSSDGIHFMVIGAVADNAGISAGGSKLDYIYSHSYPSEGIHYYRIKQIDKDERYSYSITIKINFHNSAGRIYLKFNPVHDELVILNPNQEMIRKLVILDISGRIVKEENIHSVSTYIISHVNEFSPGYYFIKVNRASGDLISLPFIKQ